MFLLCGLGNPGKEYINTRHNIGFDILDFFCKKNESKFESSRLGDLATISVKGKKVFLLKHPQSKPQPRQQLMRCP